MPWKPRIVPASVLGICVLVPSLSWAGVIAKNTLIRHYDAIVLQGSSLPAFQGVNVHHLWAYAYSESLNQWIQVPCQIDERDGSGSYFTPDDSLLDNNDEVVFMARDLGDRVSMNTWIDNEEAKSYPRHEITVTDPLDTSKQGWLYLYRSSTITDTSGIDYISYDPAADRITTPNYILGHNANGVLVDLIIPSSGGGNGQDIMDRQKTRLKGNYRYDTFWGPIYYSYDLTENSLTKKSIEFIDGPVRVIRTLIVGLNVSPLGEVATFDFTTRYYFFYSALGGGAGTITPEYGVSRIRQSNDLNANAVGMVWYNPFNSGVPIDGSGDAINSTLTVPGVNWALITGAQGTIVPMVNLPSISGATEVLYYWDRVPTGSHIPDGTSDTGDGSSYGDMGVYISGTNITGTFSFENVTYYLPAYQDSALGATLAEYYTHPLMIGKETQMYDGIAPAVIALNIVERGETYIVISWTAPGEDGTTGGPVQSYDLRYSPTPADGDITTWWQNAIQVQNEPAPASPGIMQNDTINGLSPNTTYYLGMIAEDDAGNRSPLTQLTPAMTVPIELLSFTASVDEGTVKLHWITASETNNYGFEVQRSRNDKTNFHKIGFVEGAGTSTERHSYFFIDPNLAPGTYYYRLKQVDTDGSFEYLQPLEVKVKAPFRFALEQNYPNPFNTTTTIRYQVAKPGRVVITIFNLLGQKIKSLVDEHKEAGYYTIYWDGRDHNGEEAASGIYFCQMESGKFSQLRKMILLR